MLTLEQVVEADAIHRDLYRNFIWTSDQDVHGVEEFWDRMIPKNGKYRDDCFSAEEKFWCLDENGITTKKTIPEMEIGSTVLSYDFEKKSICYEVVISKRNVGVRPSKILSHRKRVSVAVTADAPMWSKDKQGVYGFSKRKLSDFEHLHHSVMPFLQKIPYKTYDPTPEWTEDHWLLIGHYLAEGWTADGGKCVATSGYDIPGDIEHTLESCNIRYSIRNNQNGVPQAFFLKSEFKDFLKTLKRDSFDIDLSSYLNLPPKKLEKLIYGYFIGDGHIRYEDIVISTSSRVFAEQILEIMHKLGWPGYVHTQVEHGGLGNRPIHRVTFNVNSSVHKERSPDLGEVKLKIEDGPPMEMWDVTISNTATLIHESGLVCHNCDSFAMEMDYRLRMSGFAIEDRRLAACSVGRIQVDHCALVLDTPKGWMVSECNSPTLKKLNDLPYTMWYLAPRDGKITKDWEKL